MSEQSRDPFERFQREVERLFHDLVYRRHPETHFARTPWQPLVDVMASDERACVRVELAAVTRQDFRVSLEGKLLRVWGRRRPPRDIPTADYLRAEIFYGPFERVVELPWRADPNRIEARYRDGILEVHLVPQPEGSTTDVQIEREVSE